MGSALGAQKTQPDGQVAVPVTGGSGNKAPTPQQTLEVKAAGKWWFSLGERAPRASLVALQM